MGKKEIINKASSTRHIEENIFVFSNEDTSSKENRETFALELFNCAISSYKVARMCFEAQELPNCIFNLQQCIEKLVKSELYGAGISYELREIGHNPHNPYEEIFLNMIVQGLDQRDEMGFMICNRCKSCAEKIPNFLARLQEMKKIIDNIEEYADEFMEYNYGLYEAILKQYTMVALAHLFYKTEQNARYPEIKDKKITTPTGLYPAGLKNELPYVLHLFNKVIRLSQSPLIAVLLDSAK